MPPACELCALTARSAARSLRRSPARLFSSAAPAQALPQPSRSSRTLSSHAMLLGRSLPPAARSRIGRRSASTWADRAPGPDEGTVMLTPAARDRISRIQARENDPSVALRLAVDSGGCHGYTYKLELGDARQLEEDDLCVTAGVRRAATSIDVSSSIDARRSIDSDARSGSSRSRRPSPTRRPRSSSSTR